MTADRLTLGRYLEGIATEGERLAGALETQAFAATVDACPGWTLADLGYHMGDVVQFWNWVVTSGSTTTAGEPEFARPPDAELAGWLRPAVQVLQRTLRDADPLAPAYSWTPQRDVAFVQRRVPHELAIHRWDAEHAARHVTGVAARPLASDLATDGVSEFFFLATSWPVETSLTPGARVNLRAADSGATWTWWVEDSLLSWSTGVAPAAATLSGSASDLLLVLWRRVDLDIPGVTLDGDAETVRELLSLAQLD